MTEVKLLYLCGRGTPFSGFCLKTGDKISVYASLLHIVLFFFILCYSIQMRLPKAQNDVGKLRGNDTF